MDFKNKQWAFILGGSGSFGLAAAKILALKGFNLILVFRERKSTLEIINQEFELLEKKTKLIKINLNSNETDNQEKILSILVENDSIKNNISFLLHSIADGNLRPLFFNKTDEIEGLNLDDFNHTIKSMGTSLLEWTQILYSNNLFSDNASILGLTSEGSSKVFKDYAAVAAAKSVMESNMHYIAVELAQYGIRANLINAGITDSRALKAFPNYDNFISKAKERNPMGRLTTADDVAKVISFMASEDSAWINGAIITVDGGEQLLSIF